MLPPLLFLFAAAGLTDASIVFPITENTQVDTSSCPITYYGQVYTTIYINFTGEHMFVCFNGYYNPESNGDCIKAPNTENRTDFELNDDNDPSYWTYLTTLIKSSVNTITNDATCSMTFSYSNTFSLFGMGSQSALYWSASPQKLVSVLVNGDVVENVPGIQNGFAFSDISGCRISGFGVKPGTTRQSLDNCTSLICSNTSVSSTSSSISCLVKGVCTVTGPTVIDFRGQMNSVSDRCEYTLLQDQSAGFTLKANFLERRRRDVSFVDSVTLDFSQGADIQLLQGHRVLVGGSPVTLSGSVQTFNGVGLSKDQTGVTANISLGGASFSLFFDGTTAQIFIDVLAGHSYKGLCENSSSFSSSKLSSDSSCQQQYQEKVDNTVNCTAVTQQCNILKSPPFSSCNAVIDPQPYIAACTETLCKYPAVDGLRCQFLGAYAKACQKRQVNIENWETAAQCSSSTVMCPGRTCSDHEFCGQIDNSTATGCRCRAIFAAPYINSSSFGAPTVCQHNSASLTLVGCLLEQRGIDYSLLTLLDKTCKGQVDETTHMMTFNFTSDNCGTIVTTNNSQVIFTNAVTLKDKITRKDQAFIEFSCLYKKPEVNHVAFRIQDSPVVQTVVSGDWNHTVTMKAFADSMRTQMLDPSYQVQLNQKIWVELKSSGLDENLISTVTDSCWATNQPSSDSSQKYFLIQDGCANFDDQTVQVERNGDGTLNYFSFNMFKFTDESRDLYLHCKLQLCLKQEGNCIPPCSVQTKRRRRSAKYHQRDAAFLSMGWST